MKRIMIFALVLLLIIVTFVRSSVSEVYYDNWVCDPRVTVDVLNLVENEGRYSLYCSAGDKYFLELDRDVVNDDGLISLYLDYGGTFILCYQYPWVSNDISKQIVNELMNYSIMELNKRGE